MTKSYIENGHLSVTPALVIFIFRCSFDILFQADLGYSIRVYAIATQGRDGVWDGGTEDQFNQHVSSYTVKTSRHAVGESWTDYMDNGIVKVNPA